jgi:phosphoribosylformimino-5-aminoimidazole carboxamide ribotide isomerase
MIIFPAIDLKGGKCVRLAEGDMDRATVYNDDPAAQARRFAEAGARALHIVDLDAAFAGTSQNGASVARAIAAFAKVTGGRVQVGGGIRTRADVEAWLEAGVWRTVMGTAALESPDLVREIARVHPRRIVVAVDAREGLVATRGWATRSTVPVAELAQRFQDAGVAALLFTDIGRDGMLRGINIDATLNLAAATTLPVIASGGVAGLDDIRALAGHPGIEGVITGRALYDGRLDLGEALALAEPPAAGALAPDPF